MKPLNENDALLLKELTDKFLEACPDIKLGQMFQSPLHQIDDGKIVGDTSADGDGLGLTAQVIPARSVHLKYPLTAEFAIGAKQIITRENLAHPDNPVKYFHPYMAYMPSKFQYETLKLGDKMQMMGPDFSPIEVEVTQHHLDQFSAVVFRFALSF